MLLFVPVQLRELDRAHLGLNSFRVQLFERGPAGGVTQHLINVGNVADFLMYVLLLPLLGKENGSLSETHSWTMVGAEYERISQDGNLQTVYHLPINLQEYHFHPIPVTPAGDSDDDISLDFNDPYNASI